jgi:hypothetical protein
MSRLDDFLFHFSSAGAILSIVTGRQLWATDINFLNDRLEGKLPTKELTIMANKPESFLPGVTTCAKHLEALKLSLTHGLVMYTASFSEHYKSLPQYRMYCPSAGGYAIGFRKQYLSGLNGDFIKCDYSNSNLTEWCREYAKEFLKDAATRDNDNLSTEELSSMVTNSKSYARRRVIAGLTYKSSEFVHENEHRLCVLGSPNLPGVPIPKRYRESQQRNAIIPYNIVLLPNEEIEVVIVAGPNRDPDYVPKTIASLVMAAESAGTKWKFIQSPIESSFRAG